MFLLASPTSTSLTVTGWRVRQDTCLRFCHSPGGLLQHGTRWCTDRLQCVAYWTALHASSVERASTTVDCRSCYIPTSIGLMWQIKSGTSSPSQSTDVCITRRQSTWQTAVSLSRISLVVRDCAQHTVASWMYRAINEQLLTVGCSLSLDQPSGIRFQTR